MRQITSLIVALLCVITVISVSGCDMRSKEPAKKIKVKLQPVPFSESVSKYRYRKDFLDQRMFEGADIVVEDIKKGEEYTPEKAVNKVLDHMYGEAEIAKLQKKIDETNTALDEEICQRLAEDLDKHPISIVDNNADIVIEVAVTKTVRGIDNSMLIADIVTYKGIKNDKTIFSGEFNQITTIGKITPDKISKCLTNKIVKDLKKAKLL